MNLLSPGNWKQANAANLGFLALALHLEPNYVDKESGENTCPHAGLCVKTCLSKSGRHKYAYPTNVRLERTRLFYQDRYEFIERLAEEIEKGQKLAAYKGLKLAIRLNALSDIAWEQVCPEMIQFYGDVQFYDYTKDHDRALRFRSKWFPPNYHLTFSFSEKARWSADQYVSKWGINTTLIFHGLAKDKPFPKQVLDVPVVDGDQHDLRFLDPQGCFVGLRFKEVYRLNTGFRVSKKVLAEAQQSPGHLRLDEIMKRVEHDLD